MTDDELGDLIGNNHQFDFDKMDLDELSQWLRVVLRRLNGFFEHIEEHLAGGVQTDDEGVYFLSDADVVFSEMGLFIKNMMVVHQVVAESILSDSQKLAITLSLVQQRLGIPLKGIRGIDVNGALGFEVEIDDMTVPDTVDDIVGQGEGRGVEDGS